MHWLGVGPEVPGRLKAPFRLARDLVMQKQILRRVVRPLDLAQDIISTSVDALPELHASRVDERVVYQRWHVWFGPQTAKASSEHQRLANRAIEAISAGFAATGTPFDAVCADGLRGWLADAISLVEAHCAGAPRRSALPRRLWTGSGGIIWNRILQWAVCAAGGTAVGHDHGSGVGHVAPEIYRTMFEYETTDHFATFTENQAEGHRALFSPHLLAIPRTVNVEAVADRRAARIRPSRTTTGRPRKVMILSSYYFGDVITCEGFVPDLAMLDFEVRLIAELKLRGYEVIYKPHPLIVTRPPHDMAARLGAVELDRPSEEVLHLADVVLMSDAMSTAFASTLASDRPAVLVEFGLAPLTPKARALLMSRAPIVSARFDDQNRVQIDWDELAAAIEAAPRLDDGGFIDAYYGDCKAK
jgi:hypothetical protein